MDIEVGTTSARESEEEINQLLLGIMEGYSESVLPPLSQIPPPPLSSSSSPLCVDPATATATTIVETEMGHNASRKRGRQLGAITNGESLRMERDRRLKMSQMFTELKATVPGIFAKAKREVIVNETIQYIKDLEKKKQRLEELKESMKPVGGSLMMVPCKCNITVTVSSNVAFFGIQSVAQPGLVTLIFKVFCKHQAEILAANVSVNHGQLTLAVTALVHNGDENNTFEKIKRELMNL